MSPEASADIARTAAISPNAVIKSGTIQPLDMSHFPRRQYTGKEAASGATATPPAPTHDRMSAILKLDSVDDWSMTLPVMTMKTFRAKPGQMDDLIQLLEDARAEMLRINSNRTVRIFQASLAGPDTNDITIMIEYPDMATFAAARDSEFADEGWQTIGDRANGNATPADTLTYQLLLDITPG